MKHLLLGTGALILYLSACQPDSHEATPTTVAPASPIPTKRIPTETLSSPTHAPIPSDTVAFYRLRVEFTTTSDWSPVELLTPQYALTMRVINTEGNPSIAEAGAKKMSLAQPLAAAEEEKRVGLTADFALDPAAAGKSLRFRMQKGDLNGSVVRVSALSHGEALLLEEVDHRRVVEGSGDVLRSALRSASTLCSFWLRTCPGPLLEDTILRLGPTWQRAACSPGL